MKSKTGKFLLPCLAAGMLLFASYHVLKTHQALSQEPPPIDPSRSPFGRTVAASGIVEAETDNIAIGSALPGVVLEVYVPVAQVGQLVKQGDPLFLIDNRQLLAQLKYLQANLAAAKAQLSKLEMQPRPEELPPSEAAVKVAEATLAMQLDIAERNARLVEKKAISVQDYTQSALSAQAAQHQLSQARANLELLKAGAWEPDKAIARANVELAAAQIEQIKTDLDRTLVRAPVDGKVLQVNVRPGEYVGTPPGQAVVVLGSVHKLHIRVDIDEHDIPRAYRCLGTDVAAFASPRGDPSMKIPLRFVRVEPFVVPKKSLTGDNTERVDTRVLPVIYRLEGDQPSMFVGMQVDVFLNAEGK